MKRARIPTPTAASHDAAVRSLAALEAMGHAVAVLDAAGLFLLANHAARVILESADGLSMGSRGLRAQSPSEDAALRSLIHQALGPAQRPPGTGGLVRVSRPSSREAFVVTVAPLMGCSACGQAQRPEILVLIRDPEREAAPTPEALRTLWGLTQAEARVCSELVRGLSVTGIAALLRVEVDTVRKHVKEVFGKTGTNRQAALTTLVLSSLVGMKPMGA